MTVVIESDSADCWECINLNAPGRHLYMYINSRGLPLFADDYSDFLRLLERNGVDLLSESWRVDEGDWEHVKKQFEQLQVTIQCLEDSNCENVAAADSSK